MSLNLKNPRAQELAARLAKMTGESLTTAVIRALELRLENEARRRAPKSKAERILEFGARFAEGMPPECTSASHGELLYGDDGLPR